MKVKLGDICDIKSGGTPLRSNNKYWDNGNIPWVKISDINNKYLYQTSEHITELGLKNSSAKLFNKGTILYTIFATLGDVCILDIDATTNQAIAGITLLNNKIDKNYLYYYLVSKKNYVNTIGRGVAQNNINLNILRNFSIDILPLEEQKKIANTLDKVTNLIELRKKQLEKLDIFSKSLFVEMFGNLEHNANYPYKKIGEISNVISGGTPNRKKEDYWVNGTINWVKTTELKNTKINDTEEKISALGLKNSSAKIVPKNTILVAMYGQGKTRGMTALLNIEASTNQACACILPNNNINYMYLWKYMILSYNQLRNMAKGGNQPNLNLDIIKNFKILIPPIELQNKFAKRVKHIDKIKSTIQNSLNKLETLKKSLMQEYFG